MASYKKQEFVANGNTDVELNDIQLKEKLDSKPDRDDSSFVVLLKLCICFISGIFFGIALEKGRGNECFIIWFSFFL